MFLDIAMTFPDLLWRALLRLAFENLWLLAAFLLLTHGILLFNYTEGVRKLDFVRGDLSGCFEQSVQ